MISVRLVLVPLAGTTLMLPSGIKFGSDEMADTVTAWVSTSETMKGILIDTVAGVLVLGIFEIVGG